MPTLRIKEALATGLRPRSDILSGSRFFETFTGLKASPRGAVYGTPLAMAFSESVLTDASVTVEHPFPQVFRGQSVTLLADADKIFYVDESDWSLTEITLYDLYSPEETGSIVPVGAWQFADFGPTWFLFNGSCVVCKTGWVDSSKVFVQSMVSVTCGCAHRGSRLILGGFNAADFWSKWTWTSFLDKTSDWGFSAGAPGPNCIWYSGISDGDFLHLFLPTLATYGAENASLLAEPGFFDETDPYFLELARRVSSGIVPMSFQGTVWNVKPLGRALMAYGSDGVCAAMPVNEPAPGYGRLSDLLRVGIASRTAVGGDDYQHWFVDADGVLWTINGELELKRLERSEYLSSLLGNEFTISYDKEEREVYITADDETYVMTESGMSRSYQVVNSFIGRDSSYNRVAVLSETITEEHVATLELGQNEVQNGQFLTPYTPWKASRWQTVPLGAADAAAEFYNPIGGVGELYQESSGSGTYGMIVGTTLYILKCDVNVLEEGVYPALAAQYFSDFGVVPGQIIDSTGTKVFMMDTCYNVAAGDIFLTFIPINEDAECQLDNIILKGITNISALDEANLFSSELLSQTDLTEGYTGWTLTNACTYEEGIGITIQGSAAPSEGELLYEDILEAGKIYRLEVTATAASSPFYVSFGDSTYNLSWFYLDPSVVETWVIYSHMATDATLRIWVEESNSVTITAASLKELDYQDLTEHFDTSTLTESSDSIEVLDYTYPAQDGAFELITHADNLGSDGLKQLKQISVAYTGINNLTAKVYWRVSPSGTWLSTEYKPVNSRGELKLALRGLEFKFALTGEAQSGGRIDSISIAFDYYDPNAVPEPREDIQVRR